MKGKHGRNQLMVDDAPCLIVEAGGTRVHLVRLADVAHDGARPAVDEYTILNSRLLPSGGSNNYDPDALSEAIWHPRTLCGVEWGIMAASDAGPLTAWQEPTYVPDCKRCLRTASRGLLSSPVDTRVPLVADEAGRLVEGHGCAQIEDVPGDQTEHVRAAIRQACKVRKLRCYTVVDSAGTIHVSSSHRWNALSELERLETMRQILETAAVRAQIEQPWQLSWRTWPTV